MTSETPLASRLSAAIRADGPMTIAAFMQACLADPQSGYYTTRDPFGSGGDFITAPEISQMFGEIIGAWAVEVWHLIGAPSPFALVELGPGRGTLMRDLLRVARLRREFFLAARVHLVENSPRLQEVQRDTLLPSGARLAWHETIHDLPALPRIVVANEFFDALPIRQFVRRDGRWAERMVGLNGKGRLAFGLRPNAPGGLPALAPDGAVKEIAGPAVAMMTALARHVVAEGGAVLAIDYGYARPAFGDTLQAVRRHEPVDPLAFPGESDLTAHVDFAALRAAAIDAGAEATRVQEQGAFLSLLGLRTRAERLADGKDAAGKVAIVAAVERLAGPDAMGTLFKAMAVSRPGVGLPGFD